MIPWLTDDAPFPPVESALKDPNGLLAAGGEQAVWVLESALDRGKGRIVGEPGDHGE